MLSSELPVAFTDSRQLYEERTNTLQLKEKATAVSKDDTKIFYLQLKATQNCLESTTIIWKQENKKASTN